VTAIQAQRQARGERLLSGEESLTTSFLTDIRPVGEEKSELFPEPAYFTLSWEVLALTHPEVRRYILSKTTAAEFGASLRRVLAGTSALHISGWGFQSPWGREMWLSQTGGWLDPDAGVVARLGDAQLTDADVADMIEFSNDVASAYRADGQVVPSLDSGLGPDYRILDPASAGELADRATGVDRDGAQAMVSLWAAVRALSFLMEGETRDALMMHGPYPLGTGDRSLVVFECSDLHWSIYPRLPMPEGEPMRGPTEPLPYASLAIALVVEGVEFQADRFGTLYLDPWSADSIVAASLYSRGTDEWAPGPLESVDLGIARDLRRRCEDVQEEMFLQLATMSVPQRLAVGQTRQLKFSLCPLSSAGMTRAEIEAELERYSGLTRQIWDEQLETTLAAEKLPFYARLDDYLAGRRPNLFTPLRTQQGEGGS
jgi:hypothetical protein